jgi:hypothetical protein
MRHPGRATTYVITFLLGTTLTGAVSAVAAAGHSAKACETAKQLVVGAVHGKCPGGTALHAIGATGSRGSRGRPGTNGYSVAYLGLPQVDASENLPSGYTVVNRILQVPAGSYVGSYQVSSHHSGTGNSDVSCHFATSNVNIAPGGETVAGPGSYVELAGSAPLTMTQPGEVDLACTADTASVSIGASTLVAIRVNATIQSS